MLQLSNCIRLGLNRYVHQYRHQFPPFKATPLGASVTLSSRASILLWAGELPVLGAGPSGTGSSVCCLASCLLACLLLYSATDPCKTRALESVCFRPVRPFPANGAVVQDAVRISFLFLFGFKGCWGWGS